jgi:hypothetical protein
MAAFSSGANGSGRDYQETLRGGRRRTVTARSGRIAANRPGADAMPSIVGIAGSLRKGSYNAALLRAAVELARPGTSVERLQDFLAGFTGFIESRGRAGA